MGALTGLCVGWEWYMSSKMANGHQQGYELSLDSTVPNAFRTAWLC
jgi:hypothetical protein